MRIIAFQSWVASSVRSAGLALGIVSVGSCLASAPSATERGLAKVIPGAQPFVRLSEAPEGKTWVYQLALPFQLSADKAALFCNVRESGAKGLDYEVGVDVIIFDDLKKSAGLAPIPVTRVHEGKNPNSKPPGKRAFMAKYPARGGFVPLGAKRDDGSPFPHAGTGFGLNLAVGWNWDDPDSTAGYPGYRYKEGPPWGTYTFSGAEAYSYFELHQFAYDGTKFEVKSSRRVAGTDLLPGWVFGNGGITNAIPDGDDLLVGMVGGRKDAKVSGSGLMRWRFLEGEWKPVAYTPVPGCEKSYEPSLVRDRDGSLLFLARRDGNDILIWRSQDGGTTWTKIIHVGGVVSRAPIVLNRAVDGTPYVAANLYQVFLGPLDKIFPRLKPGGPYSLGGGTRNAVYLWPLNNERNGLGIPLKVRDCLEEWGPPSSGSAWMVDHPIAAPLRLADGRWHNVLVTRIRDFAESIYAAPPTERTGTYLDEIVSRGEPVPVWNF